MTDAATPALLNLSEILPLGEGEHPAVRTKLRGARDVAVIATRGRAMGSFLSAYWNDFIARFDGPLHFRLFMQPLMAIFFATRDGRRDAIAGRSAYLWSLVSDPAQRRYLLESGWKGISTVFLLALALDAVYQFMVWHGLKPFQALMTAVVLAVIPYVILRGPVNRLLRVVKKSRPSV